MKTATAATISVRGLGKKLMKGLHCQFKMAESCFQLPLEAAVVICLVIKASWLA